MSAPKMLPCAVCGTPDKRECYDPADPSHCECWQTAEVACCRCGYDGDRVDECPDSVLGEKGNG